MAYTSINKPSNYFNTVLYTGDGNTGNSITGVNFQPDFVWIKNRGAANSHNLHDVIRGITNRIRTDSTAAEDTTDPFTSFDSDGFTLNSTGGGVNGSTENYVSWNWLAGGTAVSNTDGSITSTVSANTTSGFSIVSYTGTGSALNFGHGLGVAPSVVIIKDRNGTAGSGWLVGHTGIGMTNYLKLNSTQASTNNTDVYSQNASSSLVYIGVSAAVNENTKNYIAYCFAEKKGFSKFGKYSGNSSTDGAFVYTGFKPALVIFKSTGGTESWSMVDNKRDTDNVVKNQLFPNLNIAEETTNNVMDFCSNGFKIRNSDTRYNYSSYTYIYMAFAENPFVTSTGIPTTAR